MRSGDRPGLQNRRAAGHPVAGGFDPHSLPPFFNGFARQLVKHGFGRAEGGDRVSTVPLDVFTDSVSFPSPATDRDR